MNETPSVETIRTLLAQAWREGVTAQSPEYAVNPYETTMNDARIRAALNPNRTTPRHPGDLPRRGCISVDRCV